MFIRRYREDRGDSAGLLRTPGFTLIEIVIAMTIVIILGTLGVVGIRRYVGKAKVLKTETNLKASLGLINEYYDEIGSYPSTLRDLVVRPTDAKIASRWRGYADEKEFITGCFVDGWQHDIQYKLLVGPGQSSAQGQRAFELYSWGPKGESAPQEEWIDAWSL